ncbi:hypothetical protein [Phyllobacterium chamaecytisi]|uniref:hypothetical protein n=1 Tax=Phyllobacterium chamaecytisi TaxID=2876082 RepID=UPI001CC9D407|nr:hypothetical protein [Phyllobacterium sp. KW56]MBZ9604260.1 hypothetical protein [Phyllobacterium sp. KW56]
MSSAESLAFNRSVLAMRSAIDRMTASVPKPVVVQTVVGPNYRYLEADVGQALVLKSVRILSALLAGRTLLEAGFFLDAGASMRILDEAGSDILFLAGPIIFRTAPEKSHEQYLKEFFQEEFDHSDPLKSTQKRHRVNRGKIRAYVARTYQGGMNVSDIVSVTETIDSTFSGYVHGAAVHTLDAYDGRGFRVPMAKGDHPLETIRDQFSQYTSRALSAIATAAKALGDEDLFSNLYQLDRELYDEYGSVHSDAVARSGPRSDL